MPYTLEIKEVVKVRVNHHSRWHYLVHAAFITFYGDYADLGGFINVRNIYPVYLSPRV